MDVRITEKGGLLENKNGIGRILFHSDYFEKQTEKQDAEHEDNIFSVYTRCLKQSRLDKHI